MRHHQSLEVEVKCKFVSLAEHYDSNSKESSSIFNSSEGEIEENKHSSNGSISNRQIEIVLEPNHVQLADDDEERTTKKKQQARIDEIRSAMEHDGDSTWSL